jgi:glycine cleavage system H protein
MIIPDDLRYSADHEWVRLEGDLARIGITDFAQDNLGDVVYLQLPDVGRSLSAGESFGEVESTKSVSDVFAPVSGEIVETNDRLESEPALANSDPYGDGWICVIRMTEATQLDGLLDAAGYRALISD